MTRVSPAGEFHAASRPAKAKRAPGSAGWMYQGCFRILPSTLDGLPLVKAVSRDQAAMAPEAGAEGRLVGGCLAPGIVELVANTWILRPGRHQPPAHQLADASGPGLHADDRDAALRRDVVTRAPFRAGNQPEVLDQVAGSGVQGIASAHGDRIRQQERVLARLLDRARLRRGWPCRSRSGSAHHSSASGRRHVLI